MGRRWRIRLLVIACLLPLVIWGYDHFQTTQWASKTDLEVEFVVTEADSGAPIPGARVEVQSQGGFYDEKEKQEFALAADSEGTARKECRNSLTSGTRSGLRFTDTSSVNLPWWKYRVSAAGFKTSEWTNIDVPDFRKKVQPDGPHKSKLVVEVSLSKKKS